MNQLMTPVVEMTPLSEIHPYEHNSKIHPTEQIQKLIRQIKTFGWLVPIVVNSNDKTIVSGHLRRLAALEMEMTEVPVIWADMNPEEASAARIADNKVAEAPWNEDFLKMELRVLKDHGFDMDLTAFAPIELDFYITGDEGDLSSSNSEGASSKKAQDMDIAHVRMLQLYLNDENYPEMMNKLSDLQKIYGTSNHTDTVVALIRERHSAHLTPEEGLVGPAN
jgi:ParB-like chromosome segregation protein Spo0J